MLATQEPLEPDITVNVADVAVSENTIEEEKPKTPEEIAFEKLKFRLEYDGNNYIAQTFAIWFFQISLIALIANDLLVTGNLEDLLSNNTAMVFSRFVAIMIMHVYVLEEIQNGTRMMKYSLNHWWKFTYPSYAWIAGFLQVIAMYAIEITNIFVVMASPNIIEIVKDFMALTVISEFDDYFALATGDCLVMEICSDSAYSDLFTIEVTTSKDAIDDDEANGKIRNRKLEPCESHKKAIENMKKELQKAGIKWTVEEEK